MQELIETLKCLGFEGIYKNYNKEQLQEIYEKLCGSRPNPCKKHGELSDDIWTLVRDLDKHDKL